jgi:hypothetical protein
MHDIGGLVWIVLVIVGVISTIVRSSRRSVAQRSLSTYQSPPQPQGPAPPRPADFARSELVTELENIIRQSQVAAQPAPPPTAPKPPPVAAPAPAPPPRPARVPTAAPRPLRAQKLFADRRSLVRAVIASEVLGKPLALRNEYRRY